MTKLAACFPLNNEPVWTEERIEQLRALLGKGLTFREVRLEMRLTRNTVMGKAYRLGLKSRSGLKCKPRFTRVAKQSNHISDPTKGPIMSLISKSGVSMKGSGSSAKTFMPAGSGSRPTPSKHKIMTTAPSSTKLDSRQTKGALK